MNWTYVAQNTDCASVVNRATNLQSSKNSGNLRCEHSYRRLSRGNIHHGGNGVQEHCSAAYITIRNSDYT